MNTHLTLLLAGILTLTLFSGCVQKAQPLACFKGSPACYTKHNTHEVTCSTCVAVL